MYQTDKGKFYRELRGENIKVDKPPERDRLDAFWRSIYEDQRTHNEEAEWLETTRRNPQIEEINEMEFEPLTEREVMEKIRRTSNWKTPGPDMVQNIWLKKITVLREPLTKCFNRILNGTAEIPEWMTKVETVLIPKTGETQNPGKYRPITCLLSLI